MLSTLSKIVHRAKNIEGFANTLRKAHLLSGVSGNWRECRKSGILQDPLEKLMPDPYEGIADPAKIS